VTGRGCHSRGARWHGGRKAGPAGWDAGLDGIADARGDGAAARRIEQASGDTLLNQGTIYASLVRLQQKDWISAEWGTSDNNRKAKFYSITKGGRKQLSADTAYWRRLTGVMGRVLALGTGANQE